MVLTKKKIDHYWYYYKWHFIASLCVIVALIYTFYSCASVVKPDLTVTYVGTMPLKIEDMTAFEQEYAKYVVDSNGDNKQTVTMQKIEFSPQGVTSDAEAENATTMKLSAELMLGESTLFIFSADMLDILQKQEAFQKLSSIGIEENYIKLNGKPVLKVLNLLGDDYMAAVRVQPTRANDKEKMKYENAFRVLKEIK